jgi:predicted kinase
VPRLILICGLPGSGKTTLATRLAARVPAVRLCPDDWLRGLGIDLFDEAARGRLEALMWEHTQELLASGLSVVLEFGFWARSERDEKRSWARSCGVGVELRFVDAPLPELLRRVEARTAAAGDSEVLITGQHLARWSRVFQAPDEAELGLFDAPEEQEEEDKRRDL